MPYQAVTGQNHSAWQQSRSAGVRVDPGNAGGALCPKLSKRTKNDKLIDLLLNSHLIAELFDSVGQALDGSLLVQKEVQDSSP